jgi:precorrin-2/cobalt-factor-2 C20-methyltransferase
MPGRQARPGTLYALGLGPGDPELVTVKAVRIMRSVATLLVPVRREGDEGYAWQIARPHLEPGRQEVVRLPFPQERGDVELDAQWDRHAESVLVLLDDGRDAAFLTEGDPLLYGTFVQLAAGLRRSAPELPIEVVPGVSSITAAAAAAGDPLVARGGRLAVLPAVYGLDDLRRTLVEFDTVVLLKVNRVLGEIVEALERLGLAERALLVERCGRPEQRIVRGLGGLAGPVDYFSLVIVHGEGRGGVAAR